MPRGEPDDPHIVRLGDEVLDAYLAAVPGVRLVPSVNAVTVAHTPLHGVGGEVVLAAFERAGFAPPRMVAEQAEPDGTFPTVPFPNPEEPGAMDLLMALAADIDADIALANDPDADRLGAAIPTLEGEWRRLTGDELGWLLADHILRHTSGDDRLVVTTLVSSSLLGRMAMDAGVHYAETYTGFKWIARAILERPDRRFVFGYEQALGYLVTDQSARQGRHHRGRDGGRGRRAGEGAGRHSGRAAGRHRGPLRSPQHRRAFRRHGAGEVPCRDGCATGPPAGRHRRRAGHER